jgi:hypothetical protein
VRQKKFSLHLILITNSRWHNKDKIFNAFYLLPMNDKRQLCVAFQRLVSNFCSDSTAQQSNFGVEKMRTRTFGKTPAKIVFSCNPFISSPGCVPKAVKRTNSYETSALELIRQESNGAVNESSAGDPSWCHN